jgi:hypothetical protein
LLHHKQPPNNEPTKKEVKDNCKNRKSKRKFNIQLHCIEEDEKEEEEVTVPDYPKK